MSQRAFDNTEKAKMTAFLNNYAKDEVVNAARDEKDHITVDANDLMIHDMEAYELLINDANRALAALREAMADLDKPVDYDFDNPQVRVLNPSKSIHVHEIRGKDVGEYAGLMCQVEEVTGVQRNCIVGAWECQVCGNETRIVEQGGGKLSKPNRCPSCERQAPHALLENRSEWRDKQYLKAVPLPEETSGYTNASIPVHVYDELCGEISPGDRVRIPGIIRVDTDSAIYESSPSANREFYFEANGFEQEQQTFDEITAERREEIEALSKEPDLFDRLIESFAPHIVTTDDTGRLTKLGLVLQMFGGVDRPLPHGETKRGTINILLLGDPETGKTDLLDFAASLVPKSVHTSGKGATAAGLTATAERSELTGSWTLTAGALVLASGGLACIDEFDKMADSAQTSMHDAMESQRIPVSKAGINTVLPAKTAVLAAANPESGTYDMRSTVDEQIDIDEALFSRFDLVFVFKDEPDAAKDELIATMQHSVADENPPEDMNPDIESDLFRQYIAHARQEVEPVYASDDVRQMAVDFFKDEVRQSGSMNPPGYRINDAMRRLATASARARLSPYIEGEDVARAKRLIRHHLVHIATDEYGNYDKNASRGKASTGQWQVMEAIKRAINELDAEYDDGAPHDAVVDAVVTQEGVSTMYVSELIEKMKTKRGDIYAPNADDHYRVA